MAIKWGGAAVTLLLVVVWIGSEFWSVAYFKGCMAIGNDWRGVVLIWNWRGWDTDPPKRFGPRSTGTPRSWVPRWERVPGRAWYVSMPLWIPGALALTATSLAWRKDILARRRARLNLCPKCHYDRAGLAPGAACPECGHSPA
jgi:hypothetical protein